jgi:hypothetical protein
MYLLMSLCIGASIQRTPRPHNSTDATAKVSSSLYLLIKDHYKIFSIINGFVSKVYLANRLVLL